MTEEFYFPELRKISAIRQRPLFLLAASSLDTEMLPEVYQCLNNMAAEGGLDILLIGRGGEVNAARRLALMFKAFSEEFSIIVPHHCQSACTLLALSANTVIASDMAMFSPIDPRLHTEQGGEDGLPGAIASEDVRLFTEMCENWFQLSSEAFREQLFAALAGSVYPTTLTSLYRAEQEIKLIANELLGWQLPDMPEAERQAIVNKLFHGFHSHAFALCRADMQSLGLNITRHQELEKLAWQLAYRMTQILGGAARLTAEQPRTDLVMASTSQIRIRQRIVGRIAPNWLIQENPK